MWANIFNNIFSKQDNKNDYKIPIINCKKCGRTLIEYDLEIRTFMATEFYTYKEERIEIEKEKRKYASYYIKQLEPHCGACETKSPVSLEDQDILYAKLKEELHKKENIKKIMKYKMNQLSEEINL